MLGSTRQWAWVIATLFSPFPVRDVNQQGFSKFRDTSELGPKWQTERDQGRAGVGTRRGDEVKGVRAGGAEREAHDDRQPSSHASHESPSLRTARPARLALTCCAPLHSRPDPPTPANMCGIGFHKWRAPGRYCTCEGEKRSIQKRRGCR